MIQHVFSVPSAAPEDVDDLIFLNEPWTRSDR